MRRVKDACVGGWVVWMIRGGRKKGRKVGKEKRRGKKDSKGEKSKKYCRTIGEDLA